MILVTRGRQTGGKFRRLRIPIRARFAKRGDELEDGGIPANRFGEIWKQCRFACPKTRRDSVRRIVLPGNVRMNRLDNFVLEALNKVSEFGFRFPRVPAKRVESKLKSVK